MNEVIKVFGEINIAQVLAFFAAILVIFRALSKAYKLMVEDHDARQKREATFDKILLDLNDIKEEQLNLKVKVEHLALRQAEIDKEDRERNLNKLRDKLLQDYRFYTNPDKNPMLSWTDVEKETFDRLFKDYEDLGGNGLLHKVVQPAMIELNVIHAEDMEEYKKLVNSRKV